eukprot:839859_1
MLYCCVCRECLHAHSFSRNQLSKSANKRTCMDCMPRRRRKQTKSYTFQSTYRCTKCDQNVSSYLFSKSQLSKGITRKCKQCIAIIAANQTRNNKLFSDSGIYSRLNKSEYRLLRQTLVHLESFELKHLTNPDLFNRKIAKPFIELFITTNRCMIDQFSKHIPKQFHQEYLKQIQEITKQKIDMFYHSIEKHLKDDERIVFQSVIHNALNDTELKQDVINILIQTFPPNHVHRDYITKFGRFLSGKFRDAYRTALHTNELDVHWMVMCRIYNAFKHDDSYGIFVALQFWKTVTENYLADICEFTDSSNHDLRLFEKHKDYFMGDPDCMELEWDQQTLKDILPIALKNKTDKEIMRFMKDAITNKEYDEERFDNEKIELACNPLPKQLYSNKRFITFLLANVECINGCVASMIYEYLTGYLFDIETPHPLYLDETRMIDCFNLDSKNNVDEYEYIRELSNHNLYTIRWTKCKSDFGKYNKIELISGVYRHTLACVYERDFDRQYEEGCRHGKFAILIRNILQRYKCNWNKLEIVDISCMEKDGDDEYMGGNVHFEKSVLDACRKAIHSNIKSTQRHKEAWQSFLYEARDMMRGYQYEAMEAMDSFHDSLY